MSTRYLFGRTLQVMGMAVVLVGLSLSISLGFQDEGFKTMGWELAGLVGGGLLFYLGCLLQRSGEG
ncbi:MAG: hypothetical protein ACE5H3_08850 [Planctomycetota bacterium]